MIRRFFLLAGFVSLAALAALFVHWRTDPIRYANFDVLAEGMTKGQVIEVLGCPPGTYCNAVPTSIHSCCIPHYGLHWHGRRGSIIVTFMWGQDTLNSAYYQPSDGSPRSTIP